MLLPATACCLMSACALKMNLVDLASEAEETVSALSDEFTGTEDAGSYEPLEWWTMFTDPVLDSIIEAVLHGWGQVAQCTCGIAAHGAKPK